nr:hypothetical protein [Tanacetum cinerariifolium]
RDGGAGPDEQVHGWRKAWVQLTHLLLQLLLQLLGLQELLI